MLPFYTSLLLALFACGGGAPSASTTAEELQQIDVAAPQEAALPALVHSTREAPLKVSTEFQAFLRTVHIDLDRAFKTPPQQQAEDLDEDVYYLLGVKSALADDAPLAAWGFTRAADLAPRPSTLSNLGFVLNRLGKPAKALTVLELVHVAAPNARVKVNLAMAHYQLGDYETAAGLLQEATRAVPKNAEFHFALAKTLAALEDPRAYDAYWAALRADPTHTAAAAALDVWPLPLASEDLHTTVVERLRGIAKRLKEGEVYDAIRATMVTLDAADTTDDAAYRRAHYKAWMSAPLDELEHQLTGYASRRKQLDTDFGAGLSEVSARFGQGLDGLDAKREDWCTGVVELAVLSRVEQQNVNARLKHGTHRLIQADHAARLAHDLELEQVIALWEAEIEALGPLDAEALRQRLALIKGTWSETYTIDQREVDFFAPGTAHAGCAPEGGLPDFGAPGISIGPISFDFREGSELVQVESGAKVDVVYRKGSEGRSLGRPFGVALGPPKLGKAAFWVIRGDDRAEPAGGTLADVRTGPGREPVIYLVDTTAWEAPAGVTASDQEDVKDEEGKGKGRGKGKKGR